MGKDVKYEWFLILGLFLVPFSGKFSSNVWEMQSNVLYIILSILAVQGIAKLHPKARKDISKAVATLAVVQGVIAVLQFFNIDPIFHTDKVIGLSASKNQSGLFFGVTLPLVLKFFPLAIPLSLFGLICSKTATVMIATAVGMVFIASQNPKVRRIIYPLVLISILVFAFGFNDMSVGVFKERVTLYTETVISAATGEIDIPGEDGEMYFAKCNPLFGFGAGSFEKLSPASQQRYMSKVSHRFKHAHNDYLEIFFEFGWVGLIITCIFLYSLMYGFIQAKQTETLIPISSCLIIHLVSALGIFTIHTATSGMLFITILGLYLGEIQCKRYYKKHHSWSPC